MTIYQDSSEMHEVYKKIYTLLKDEILRFDDEEESQALKTTLQDVVFQLQAKNKHIMTYMRKMAELDLRKQVVRSTQGYSLLNMSEITIPENKIKTYLANGSLKILQ